MGFLDKLHDLFQDETTFDLCSGLLNLGVDARLAHRDRAEERIRGGIGRGHSLGVIDIQEGPIRWVNTRKLPPSGSTQHNYTVYWTDYGVPDPKVAPGFPTGSIESVRKRTFPVIGDIADVLWRGESSLQGVVNRLNEDVLLKRRLQVMERHDVEIRAHPGHGCWILSMQTKDVPSRDLWECYQAIAQHLLSASADVTAHGSTGSP